MTTFLVAAGLVVLAMTVVDVVWTTVAAGSGAGPLTGRLSRMLWRAALRVDRSTQVSVLTPAGVLIVVTILGAWIFMILAGWLLVFAASDGAVRHATTGVPGDLLDRILFVGYTVLTLGLGNFVPGEGAWQIATVVATGSGLLLVTLSVTYLIPVASAVVQRRQLAGQISSLGGSSHEIVTNGWNGSDFGSLEQNLSMLLPTLHTLRLQHLSYPVLHVFHTRSKHDAAPSASSTSTAPYVSCAAPCTATCDRMPRPSMPSPPRWGCSSTPWTASTSPTPPYRSRPRHSLR